MRLATRLDRYPGKMVSRLADRLIERYAAEADSVLDPFCGSGAILVAANRAGLPVSGMDLNPISELFYHVKIGGFDSARAMELGRAWTAEAQRTTAPLPVDWDGKNYWFTQRTLDKFERLRAASRIVPLGDAPECWPVLLSYVLAVRLCSRADQRSPKPFISQQARRSRAGRHFDPNGIMLELLEELSMLYGGGCRENAGSRFVCADVCDPRLDFGRVGRHSHAITSPPYINAQDYFRNFKLELYLLEDVLPFSVSDLRERFVGRERGRLLDGVPRESIERDFALAPVLRHLRARDRRLGEVVHRYLYDMDNAFDAVKRTLDDNACLVVVCGDNLIGGVKIRTWGVLHAILEQKGFVLFDRFSDPIRDRMLAPRRLGHRGLIKEEVVSAYRLGRNGKESDAVARWRRARASGATRTMRGGIGDDPRRPDRSLAGRRGNEGLPGVREA